MISNLRDRKSKNVQFLIKNKQKTPTEEIKLI